MSFLSVLVEQCLKSLTGLPVDFTYSRYVARDLGSPETLLMKPSLDLNKLRGKKGYTHFSLASGNVGSKGNL